MGEQASVIVHTVFLTGNMHVVSDGAAGVTFRS